MFISREEALAMAEGRRKFLSVYEGRAVLFMPFAEHVRFVSTHYVPELKRSVICTGEATCRYHHIQEVAKAHVAGLVYRKAMPYAARDAKGLPPKLPFDCSSWAAKIVEITENCLGEFESGAPFGTLATIARAPGRKNNPVEFLWIRGHELQDFPTAPLKPENIVPAVIRGTYYNAATVAIDKSDDGRIKHKI